MTTVQFSHNEQDLSEMEITGYSVFSASSDGADLNLEVKRSLHLNPKKEKDSCVYGRGNADICARFLRCGAEKDDAVGLRKQNNESKLTTCSSLEKSMRL